MRSYARCGFLRGSNEAQILPKSGEKSRHQPVFFYARAQGQRFRNHLRSLTACCGERENITRSHKTASLLVRTFVKNCSRERAIRVFSSRAAKSPRVKEELEQEKADAEHLPA